MSIANGLRTKSTKKSLATDSHRLTQIKKEFYRQNHFKKSINANDANDAKFF
jgi:hypothetical protein